jgi:hypothetical protein
MGRGQVVKAPDGGRWRVRRRWMDRPLPNLRRRFRANRSEGVEDGLLAGLPDAGAADGWWAIAIPIVLILIVFVLLPLLGVALELIAVIFVFCSGLVGRLFLGRPWIVEAAPQESEGAPLVFPIKGWRRSGKVADQLAREIEAIGRPEEFQVPEFG